MYEPERLVQMDLEHVLHPMHSHAHNSTGPLVFVRGEGATLVDAAGKEYIDAFAGLWNVNVGHGRAELAEAAAEQMRTLAYASGYAGSSNLPAIELADRLADLAPGDLKATFYTTGGAESNETAFKIARFYWKMNGRSDKVKIIALHRGYHGTTGAAMVATGMRQYWQHFDPIQWGFFHIPTHYCFRCPLGKSYPQCNVACADTLEQQILAEDPETVAAFIAEPVHGAGGVVTAPPEYFRRIREICDRYDVLWIADEVITGFGRTGKMFAQEHWEVTCDVMCFAKGVTSGYLPLGGVMVNERVHRAFRNLPPGGSFNHAYTYSLHPVCCAVALRNLEILQQEDLVARSAAMGERLLAKLRQLESEPAVGEVRGIGLMAAVDLAADKKGTPLPESLSAGPRIQAYAQERGVILRTRGDVIMLAPPFVVTEQQIDTTVNVVAEGIARAVGGKI
ncbi:MAG: aminotransferase family protein [Chloroflexota bacterium]